MGEIELLALAERVEKLSGSNRGLDATICIALGLSRDNVMVGADGWCINSATNPNPYRSPAYTTSIDAAMTLVPEGWHLHSLGKSKFMQIPWLAMLVEADDGAPYSGPQGNAATPSLALCAAALRARASMTRTTGDGDGNG